MNRKIPRRIVALALGALLCAPAAVWAQDSDDDLLGEMGGGSEQPAFEPTAPPTVDEELDAELDEVEEIEAAPATTPSKKPAEKQLEQNPAALDRIKAVPRKPVIKRGRVELAAFTGLSVNDAYYQHLTGNASVIYYLHDSFGIGIGADYVFGHLRSENVTVVRQTLTSVPAQFEFPWLFAHMDAYWVPIYGKASLFGSTIVHFDLYASAGLGAAFPGDRTVPELNAAIGQRFFLSDWLAVRVELRDHLYLDNLDVADQRSSNVSRRSDIQNYILLYAGVSFYVPPSFEYTYR